MMTLPSDIDNPKRFTIWLTSLFLGLLSRLTLTVRFLIRLIPYSHSLRLIHTHHPLDSFRTLLICLLVTLASACSGSGSSGASPDNIVSANNTSNSNSSANSAETNQSVSVAANVTLNWPIPMDREDGSALPAAEIAGYEIVYQTRSEEFQTVNIPDPLTTHYTFNALAPDDYRFAIMTYDSENRVSESSKLVQINKTQFPRL